MDEDEMFAPLLEATTADALFEVISVNPHLLESFISSRLSSHTTGSARGRMLHEMFRRSQKHGARRTEIGIVWQEYAIERAARDNNSYQAACESVLLGLAYVDRELGDPNDNLDKAIRYYQDALAVITKEKNALGWAAVSQSVGAAYMAIRRGDRADNLEQAISHLTGAVAVFTEQENPDDWARACLSLALAYRYRLTGNAADNLEQSIRWHENALRLLSCDRSAFDWASASQSLGTVYFARHGGDRAVNCEKAIGHYRNALSAFDGTQNVSAIAQTLDALGTAYVHRLEGARLDNIESAVRVFEEALAILADNDVGNIRTLLNVHLASAYLQRRQGAPNGDAQRAVGLLNQTLARLTPDGSEGERALVLAALGSAHVSQPEDVSQDNEMGIRYFEEALRLRAPVGDPDWESVHVKLGKAYKNRSQGDRPLNFERAIDHFQYALSLASRRGDREVRRDVSGDLGVAYAQRILGDPAGNIELAITHYQTAIALSDQSGDPEGWAILNDHLGLAYQARLLGDRADNFEQAIALHRHALEVLSDADILQYTASMWNNLGTAFAGRLRGTPAENRESAIEYYERGLEVSAASGQTHDWAMVAINLADAYTKRPRGDHAENMERAIALIDEAMTVVSKTEDPDQWAAAMQIVGLAYSGRLHGRRGENIERAIAYYEDALTGYRADNSNARSLVFNNLANAYRVRPSGERLSNITRAIGYYEEAIQLLNSRSEPFRVGEIQSNLGIAYMQRSEGEGGVDGDDVERAIECFKDAERVCSPDTNWEMWAAICMHLGNAYSLRRGNDQAYNRETALRYYSNAIEAGMPFMHPSLMMRLYRSIAKLLLQSGEDRWPDAQKIISEARLIWAGYQSETLTPEARKEMFAAFAELGSWSAMIAVAALDPSSGLERLEASRAVTLREGLQHQFAEETVADENCKNLLAECRRRISRLRAEAAQPGPRSAARPYGVLASDLRAAHRALVSARSALGLEATASMQIDEILGAVPDGAVLIVPVVTEFGTNIFVVPSGTAKVEMRHVVLLPQLKSDALRRQIALWIGAYRAALSYEPQSNPEAWSFAGSALETLLHWLGANIMEPALAHVSRFPHPVGHSSKHEPHLLIMPTGELSIVPLHAAYRSTAGSKRSVLDDFVVSYTPSMYSAKATRRTTTKNARSSLTPKLLALLNPTDDPRLRRGEQMESRALQKVFPVSAQHHIVRGATASKEFLARNAETCTHLHISCHGRFSWADADQSGLLLANSEWLTLPEIAADLRLDRCRWVMLAACESTVIDVLEMPEEATGHVAALRQAGAACVTGTFWAVGDLGASLFVEKAYEEHLMNGASPAQATRRAALWLRDLSAEEIASRARTAREPDANDLRAFAEIRDMAPSTQWSSASVSNVTFASPLAWGAYSCWGA